MGRKLRIAVSVFFGLLTVALCVLWAVSYQRYEIAFVRVWAHHALQFTDIGGQVELRSFSTEYRAWSNNWRWKYMGYPVDDWQAMRDRFGFRMGANAIGFGIDDDYIEPALLFPNWFSVLIVGISTVIPWLPLHRFSLRTLLIAMTLVAAVLGLAVWAGR